MTEEKERFPSKFLGETFSASLEFVALLIGVYLILKGFSEPVPNWDNVAAGVGIVLLAVSRK